jgi:hypothetical protein
MAEAPGKSPQQQLADLLPVRRLLGELLQGRAVKRRFEFQKFLKGKGIAA